ncbi:MAG TPA: DUF5994 family protein [Actinopolymorphaceae bacterium]|nr:DUF5994 family protein [Actinopolymorphaceae bacterium]
MRRGRGTFDQILIPRGLAFGRWAAYGQEYSQASKFPSGPRSPRGTTPAGTAAEQLWRVCVRAAGCGSHLEPVTARPAVGHTRIAACDPAKEQTVVFTAGDRRPARGPEPPPRPRLRWGPSMSRRATLHGAWWPRSDDPLIELPGMVLEVHEDRGLVVTCFMLGLTNWDGRPTRLRVAGRTVRLGWFTTQPAGVLTASCGDRYNLDFLIVPPDTDAAVADAAMNLATEPDNGVPASDIIATVIARQAAKASAAP